MGFNKGVSNYKEIIMAKVPQESIGEVWAKEVGFWKSYKKEEEFYLYKFEKLEHGIVGQYVLDFHSSVWIKDERTFREFAQTYEVLSGGWYGDVRDGGRWLTSKRRSGTVQFDGIANFVQQEPTSDSTMKFFIRKPFFTNRFKVEINNSKVGLISFVCDSININPSNKIYLFHKARNKFVDASNILDEKYGLHLKE